MLAWLEPNFDFRVIAREILKYIPMELDFINEARNSETIARQFRHAIDVVIPASIAN